jgi:hypothetical protein
LWILGEGALEGGPRITSRFYAIVRLRTHASGEVAVSYQRLNLFWDAHVQTGTDDKVTVFAIAILAACLATTAHEAAGHGSVCLFLGGAVTRLTSVYFRCSIGNTWIAAGGPLGNLVAFVLAWSGLLLTPLGMTRMRLLLLLTMTISIFWFAGYLIYSAVLNDGDLYFVAHDLFGKPGLALRTGAVAVGVALYWAGIQAMRSTMRISYDASRARQLLWQSWLAASLSGCVAALAYAPDRLGAMGQAALEIGAACLPMLGPVAEGPARVSLDTGKIGRSWGWIGVSLLVFVLFVVTLGRGMP